jgi:hypothetical protein
MKGRSWAALQGTCYYPIDLEQPSASRISVSRSGSGHRTYARVTVEPLDYGTEEITLPDIPQANPSASDLKRDARDRAQLAKVWNRKEGPARFTLPLALPVRPLPKGKSFGVKRVFNGKPASQPHTGTDYATPVASPVLAVADGTVVIAEDLFFEGNAVFIDHGDGLISMYFHLATSRSSRARRSRRAIRSAVSDPLAAPRDRIFSLASAGTTPALTRSSCWRTQARSQPYRLLCALSVRATGAARH